METLMNTEISVDKGALGDYRGLSSGKRQITVLSKEQWDDACSQLNRPDLNWTARRANLLVDEVRFSEADVGKRLRIGPDVVLEITSETEPCYRMDQACPGLQNALKPDWRGGVCCIVISGGYIEVGSCVELQ